MYIIVDNSLVNKRYYIGLHWRLNKLLFVTRLSSYVHTFELRKDAEQCLNNMIQGNQGVPLSLTIEEIPDDFFDNKFVTQLSGLEEGAD
jgi:hypothetical protein